MDDQKQKVIYQSVVTLPNGSSVFRGTVGQLKLDQTKLIFEAKDSKLIEEILISEIDSVYIPHGRPWLFIQTKDDSKTTRFALFRAWRMLFGLELMQINRLRASWAKAFKELGIATTSELNMNKKSYVGLWAALFVILFIAGVFLVVS